MGMTIPDTNNTTVPAYTGAELNIVTPSELIESLTFLISVGLPAMVWGPPGIGKTEIGNQVGHALNMVPKEFYAILMDPTDLHGIPYRDQELNRTRWAPPNEFPQEDGNKYLFSLEEITSATPAVQAALYRFVLSGRIGEYQLPTGSSIIACGNRESDRGVAHTMPTPLVSRFVHYTLKTDPDEWLVWAMDNDIDDDVIFFITHRPELLHEFNPKLKNIPYPCPRTWKFISDIVKKFQNEFDSSRVELATLAGTVGPGAAIEFNAFRRMKKELTHPKVVLSDPKGCKIPSKVDAVLALCGSVSRHVNDTNFDAALTFAERIKPEIAEFFINNCIKKRPDLQYTNAYVRWATEH